MTRKDWSEFRQTGIGPSYGDNDASKRLLYTPREAERLLSISHAQLYRLLGASRLSAIKIGSRSYITAGSIEAFIASLPAAKFRAPSGGEAA